MSIHVCYTLGKLSKIHRAREEMLWYDEPEYYTPNGTEGFITFKMQVSDKMLEDSVPTHDNTGFKNFEGHFNLIHH